MIPCEDVVFDQVTQHVNLRHEELNMTRLVLAATNDGLLTLALDGEVVSTAFAGQEVVSVAADGEWWFAAVTEGGVSRRRAAGEDGWEHLGLEDAHVWVVAPGRAGTALAGVEPAALWELGADGPVELAGLRSVEGYADWYSPWGPADLSAIAVDGARVVVGVEQGGVAVSNDGGVTWAARNEGLHDDVHAVAIDGSCLYATTGLGFYRSFDEGNTWAWECDGLDRGYTQALAHSGSTLLVSVASGPPPLWDEGGPDAAVFRASVGERPLQWELAVDGLSGNIGRGALAASDGIVVAGTTGGELIVGSEDGTGLQVVQRDLPPIAAVALADG